jgi:hypothetical protein
VGGCQVVPYSFDVDYDYWTTEQILYSVMPEGDAETPSSFTATGHIGNKIRNSHMTKKLILLS